MRHERQARRRLIATCVLLGVTFAGGLVAAASPLAGGAPSPESAVRRYLLALQREDVAAAREVALDSGRLADRMARYGGRQARSVWVRLREADFGDGPMTAELYYRDHAVPPAHDTVAVVERWGRWYVDPYAVPYVPCEFEPAGCGLPVPG